MNDPTDRRRILRWGDREVELLPPEARHPWLDPLAGPPDAGPAATPTPPGHASTRRIVIVSCVAAFLAGIATFTVVSAVRRGADAAPRPSLAPSTSAGRAPATSRPTTATTRPAGARPSVPSSSVPGATPSTPDAPATSAPATGQSRVVLGVTVSEDAGGVTITAVTPGSGAEVAGLRAGDTFVSVDGQDVAASADLGDIIQSHKAGDRVTIVVQRDGKDVTVTAVLGTTVS